MDPKIFTRMTTSQLFTITKSYHHRQLKILFHHYYQLGKGSNWTIHLSEDIIADLRLHLSWEIGMNVFDYHKFPRYILGEMVLDRFKKLGILSYILKAIEKNMR